MRSFRSWCCALLRPSIAVKITMDSSFDVSGDQVVRVFNVVFTRLILGHGDSVISLTIAFA
jgi:hypothetical protein